MSREDLPVIALCLTLAANLAMGAIRQADLKHKALIWSLFAAAGLLIALAAGWPWIKEWLPRVGAAVGEVAAHPVTWFVTGMLLVAALLFRRPNPATTAPTQPFHKSHDSSAQPDAATEARTAALDARIGQVDEKLRAAIHGNAEAMREEDAARFEAIRKDNKHAIEQSQKREEAFDARLKAVADAAESRTTSVFEALRDTHGPKFADLNGRIDEYAERLGGRLGDLEATFREFRRQVFDILRARDDTERLRSLDTEATGLFDKLFFAKERDYPDGEAWRADHLAWKRCIENYWAILRGHSESVGEPFASLTEADLGGKVEMPDNALFDGDEMRVAYRVMLAVNERYVRLRGNASVFMAEKCRPPANPT